MDNPTNPEIKVLLSERKIQARVQELARTISADYADETADGTEILVIGVLKGAFIFMADLTRALDIPRRIDFMAVASYDQGAHSSGTVRLVMDVRQPIEDRHVLLVEDIVDSGRTMDYLIELFRARQPASLRTCALVQKEGREPYPLDYLGFTIPDEWVVGYGLDWDERLRTLPYIGAIQVD